MLNEEQAEGLLAAVAPFQQAYLGATLARLSDAVSAAFPGGNRALPTSAELQKLIGCGATACPVAGTPGLRVTRPPHHGAWEIRVPLLCGADWCTWITISRLRRC